MWKSSASKSNKAAPVAKRNSLPKKGEEPEPSVKKRDSLPKTVAAADTTSIPPIMNNTLPNNPYQQPMMEYQSSLPPAAYNAASLPLQAQNPIEPYEMLPNVNPTQSQNEEPFLDFNATENLLIQAEDDVDLGDDLSESIRVVVRVRPPNRLELRNGYLKGISCESDHRTLNILGPDGRARPLTFNRVYDIDVTQDRFFEESGIKELVNKALEGFSACIFAFGQTGSGNSKP